jgi:hypothetical protein
MQNLSAGPRRAALLALSILLVPLAAAAADAGGVRLDDYATIGDQTLVLNGAGSLTQSGMKSYVAAFYMRARKKSLPEIAELTWWAKRISMTMTRDMSSDELGESIVAGIRRNCTPDQTKRFGPHLVSTGDLLSKTPIFKRGTTLTFDWVPSRGTVIAVDGKPLGDPIPDEAFYQAILKVWLGDRPVDPDLRTAMLGLR